MSDRIQQSSDAAPAGRTAGPSRHQQGLEEILRKSSRLMAAVGFHGTSMRELSRATGRSLSGLYHYFTSKEDLLFLINYHGFTTLNATWRRMDASFERPEEKLYGFIYLHTHYYIDNMDEMRVMNWGTQELEYKRAMEIKTLKDRHTTVARAIVQDIHVDATGEKLAARPLARQTFLLFGMMNWIFGWYSSTAHGSIDELIRDIYRTFMHGVTTRPPDADGRIEEIEALARDAFVRNSTDNMWETAPTPDLKPKDG